MTFNIIEAILALGLIVCILLQQRGAGIGGAIGGGSDASFSERRGSEKTLFRITIVIAILFFAVAALRLFI